MFILWNYLVLTHEPVLWFFIDLSLAIIFPNWSSSPSMEEPNSRSTNKIYSVLIADYNIKRLAYVYIHEHKTNMSSELFNVYDDKKNSTLYRGQLLRSEAPVDYFSDIHMNALFLFLHDHPPFLVSHSSIWFVIRTPFHFTTASFNQEPSSAISGIITSRVHEPVDSHDLNVLVRHFQCMGAIPMKYLPCTVVYCCISGQICPPHPDVIDYFPAGHEWSINKNMPQKGLCVHGKIGNEKWCFFLWVHAL